MRYLPSETFDSYLFHLGKEKAVLHSKAKFNHGGAPQKSCLQRGESGLIAILKATLPEVPAFRNKLHVSFQFKQVSQVFA